MSNRRIGAGPVIKQCPEADFIRKIRVTPWVDSISVGSQASRISFLKLASNPHLVAAGTILATVGAFNDFTYL